MLGLPFANHIHFQSLVVVNRGSEAQLQVTENISALEVNSSNKTIWAVSISYKYEIFFLV